VATSSERVIDVEGGTFTGDRATVQVVLHPGGVLETHFTGNLTGALMRDVCAYSAKLVVPCASIEWFSWAENEASDQAAKDESVAWFTQHKAKLKSAHAFVPSGIARMTVALVSMLSGARIITYRDRDSFVQMLERSKAAGAAARRTSSPE
jgi:hypothetical protein